MRISSKLDYALSCVLRVADEHSAKRIVSVNKVAEKERLEFDYVEKILIALKNAGILKSIRGRAGGYVLADSPDNISAKDIVKAIEGNILELVCFRKGRRRRCVHLDDCRIRSFWMLLREDMEEFLSSHTLEDLLKLRRKERSW